MGLRRKKRQRERTPCNSQVAEDEELANMTAGSLSCLDFGRSEMSQLLIRPSITYWYMPYMFFVRWGVVSYYRLPEGRF